MNEENKTPQPVEWVEPAPAKPRKKIRHMIWAVVLIALAMMLAGQLLGDLSMNALLYTLLCERPIFRSFLHLGPNGGSGNTWKLFGLGLLVGFAMNALCILAAYLHGDLDFSVGRFDLPYLLGALGCVCVQSGAEELLCRGYMFGAVRERYNVWVAGIVNAFLFGALHLANPGVTVLSVVNIVLFGLALSVAMAKMESLWFCVAVHTAWNFSQSIFFGLPNSGIVSQGSFLHLEAATDSVLYSTAFGVEGTITTSLVLLILSLIVLLCARRKAGN